MGELIDSRAGWIGDHLRLYRRTGGREGHFVDTRDMGGPEFTPTLLNGVPVPVIMTVTVQFTLS